MIVLVHPRVRNCYPALCRVASGLNHKTSSPTGIWVEVIQFSIIA